MSLQDSKPHKLFDFLINSRDLKNDRGLSAALGITATAISRVRSGNVRVSDGIILRIHEKLGVDVKAIRALLPSEK